MSKFCGNCGAEMDDAAVVCGNCGAAFEQAPEAEGEKKKFTIPGVENLTPQNIALFKKIGIFAAIAIVAVILVVVVINIISANTGVNAAVKDVVACIEENDVEGLVGMYSEAMIDYEEATYSPYSSYYDEDEDTEENETFADRMETKLGKLLDHLEDETNSGFSIDYEIKDKDIKELSERKVEKFNKSQAETVEQLNERLEDGKKISFEEEAITDVTEIKVKAVATEGKSKEKFDIYLTLVKENGDWKIWNLSWDY